MALADPGSGHRRHPWCSSDALRVLPLEYTSRARSVKLLGCWWCFGGHLRDSLPEFLDAPPPAQVEDLAAILPTEMFPTGRGCCIARPPLQHSGNLISVRSEMYKPNVT